MDIYSLPSIPNQDIPTRQTSRSGSRKSHWVPSSLTNSYHEQSCPSMSNKKIQSRQQVPMYCQPQPMSQSYHESSYNDYDVVLDEQFDYQPTTIVNGQRKGISLKNSFFPPNTSMTNLNRSFSARLVVRLPSLSTYVDKVICIFNPLTAASRYIGFPLLKH